MSKHIDSDNLINRIDSEKDRIFYEILHTESIYIVRCKDCKHFHYDFPVVIKEIPLLAHLVCDFWGSGCRTKEDAFCSYGEKKENGDT